MNLLNLIGIGTAYADTPGTPMHTGEGGLMSVLPMLIIFILIFYFLLIRPQSKRQKEHRKLIESVTKGDEVVTTGGIMGKVSSVDENAIRLMIAKDIEITIQKASISSVLPKGTLKSIEG